ncbi:unnamed protein product, partial [Didymodactylos carnosus]
PIVPMFTKNCREAFRSMACGRRLLRYIYEKTRLPTYLGTPILHDPNQTPEELAKIVKDSIEQMIAAHQHRPGSITKAFFDRFS